MDRARIRRRQLPHWDMPGAPYFVTTCLEGSIAARGLLELARFRTELRQHPRPGNVTPDNWNTLCWKRVFVRLEDWLDGQPAVRVLENPDLAQVVVNSLFHFAGKRYTVFAFVVMPSHIHWLFQPLPEWVSSLPDDSSRSPREQIVYSMNRFTATKCNRLLQQRGHFWHPESYNHWVRDEDELERIIGYIEANPVKAGLAEAPDRWRFSSAWHRKQTAPIGVCHVLRCSRFFFVGQDSNRVALTFEGEASYHACRRDCISELGMDLAADSLSTWRGAEEPSGMNDLSRADGMPMRMTTIEGIALVLPELPAARVRQSWSVVTLVSG